MNETHDGMHVTFLDRMGNDLSVVNAARVSFAKESEWDWDWELYECNDGSGLYKGKMKLSDADTRLIHYLARHNHWTPFAHTSIVFHIKAPIFVARQLGKHQVGMVWNEVSRRYVDDEPECWYPTEWRGKANNVKQGSAGFLKDIGACAAFEFYDAAVKKALDAYDALIVLGVCPEQARAVLPQSMFTEWVWTGSLAAWARVCKLRLDLHTQAETRAVAGFISAECAEMFPVSWAALMLGAKHVDASQPDDRPEPTEWR